MDLAELRTYVEGLAAAAAAAAGTERAGGRDREAENWEHEALAYLIVVALIDNE